MLTLLGKELKKLRIDLGITLMEMAQKLEVSAAFLSSIETGKKRIPDNFLGKLATNYSAVADAREKFEVLINQSRSEVILQLAGANYEDAELATALARRFSTMSPQEKDELRNIFKGE